jgi:hypothetical protein
MMLLNVFDIHCRVQANVWEQRQMSRLLPGHLYAVCIGSKFWVI